MKKLNNGVKSIIVLGITVGIILTTPACTLTDEEQTQTVDVSDAICPIYGTFGRPEPVNMAAVEFKVANRAIMVDLTDNMTDDQAYFVLSAKDYENLSYNTADLLRYIKDQQAVIKAYEQQIQNNSQSGE
tara:strand:+ start:86424 stop:86813 length:390 start_codon:yes stop_codon:yes gene_type:complete